VQLPTDDGPVRWRRAVVLAAEQVVFNQQPP